MLRPRLPRIGFAMKTFRRSLFNMPELEQFRKGVPGLLSPTAFDLAYTQYQSLMLEKLDYFVAGSEWEGAKTKDIAIKYARDPNMAPVFNYASMAHNNHFFFSCLSPKPPPAGQENPIPTPLKQELEDSFGSIETLREEFIATACAMFGPGFVWLVKDKGGKYSLLCTYLSGSPYPGAHYRQQPIDMNTEDKNIPEAVRKMQNLPVANTSGKHGTLAYAAQKLAPGGTDIMPILCINMWEHVYLPDYGLLPSAKTGGGKEAYAENWWHCINWQVVAENAQATSIRGIEI